MAALRILLVEDNPDDRDLTTVALGESDVETELVIAEDGVVALEILRKEGEHTGVQTPDLILLDLNLPRKSGFQVLDELKSDPDLKSIPVTVLTTSNEVRDVLTAYESYANGYVVKPVDLDEFIGAVKAITEFWGTVGQLPPN
ncbi:response regulator [Candidatus Poribacteria bacterium]|jgi:two-component system, chemotaxis family, response regulator Rcp1|nr:response regulator [Candidatus Poribacteria bacterium]MBT5532091.1 response regulator [Candidatus Poribacteria bacterium]MBT5712094.1 response regulator [Candidatus Poribacteria bacterium]MBT7100799.1 response regulator [Candidatus Poribacteria bacterium]MBT7805123.1 response regulator [Candidatus Poribacteria bacterium]